jgi:hypothetical protein
MQSGQTAVDSDGTQQHDQRRCVVVDDTRAQRCFCTLQCLQIRGAHVKAAAKSTPATCWWTWLIPRPKQVACTTSDVMQYQLARYVSIMNLPWHQGCVVHGTGGAKCVARFGRCSACVVPPAILVAEASQNASSTFRWSTSERAWAWCCAWRTWAAECALPCQTVDTRVNLQGCVTCCVHFTCSSLSE